MTGTIKKPMSRKTTVLYNGNKVTSGNITFSESPTNYDELVIYSRTNTEYYVDILPIGVDLGVGQNLTADHHAPSGTYFSGMAITTIPNGIYVDAQSNNVNWKLGVIKVVGVKYE